LNGSAANSSAGLLEQNFHFTFGLFQVFLAITRKLDAFLEQFHGFIQREVRTLQLSDYFFQARQRMLEIGFFEARFFSPALDSRLSILFTAGSGSRKSGAGVSQHSNARARTETTAL